MLSNDRRILFNEVLLLEASKEDYDKYHKKGFNSRVNQIVRYQHGCKRKDISEKIFNSYDKIPKNERDKRFVKRGISKEEEEENAKRKFILHEKSYQDYISAKRKLERLQDRCAKKEEIEKAEQDLKEKYKKMELISKRKINGKSIPEKFKDYE